MQLYRKRLVTAMALRPANSYLIFTTGRSLYVRKSALRRALVDT